MGGQAGTDGDLEELPTSIQRTQAGRGGSLYFIGGIWVERNSFRLLRWFFADAAFAETELKKFSGWTTLGLHKRAGLVV
jgi:hypothetical protein